MNNIISIEIISNGCVVTNSNAGTMPMHTGGSSKTFVSDAKIGEELSKLVSEYRNQSADAT